MTGKDPDPTAATGWPGPRPGEGPGRGNVEPLVADRWSFGPPRPDPAAAWMAEADGGLGSAGDLRSWSRIADPPPRDPAAAWVAVADGGLGSARPRRRGCVRMRRLKAPNRGNPPLHPHT